MSKRLAAAKFLGTFDAGLHYVDLYAREGVDAEFRFQPGVGKKLRIVIGVNDSWWTVLGCLMHEITEATYVDMGLRYVPGPDISKDNGAYAFFMSHTQFSEATARAGLFLSKAIPALEEHWKKINKEKP